MKSKLNKFILIITLSIFIIFIPNKVNALSTNYKKINEESISLNDDNSSFQFTKINFKNWSNLENPSFGLSGIVYNGNDYDVSFLATATYYDSNYNLIATTYDSQFVPAKEYNSYNHMSDLSEIKGGYTANDIVYYKLDVIINKKETNNYNDYTIPSKNDNYKFYDYVIDKYDVNIIVNENNTFDITETITAYFNFAKHGIYREIPLKNNITRLDGTSSKNKVRISNLSVNNEYTTFREDGNLIIKIGSDNTTITGEQKYVIKYKYNIGKDPLKGKDELYYNIIGTNWNTVIGNVTFSITMPKKFDSSKLGFSSGTMGSTNSSKITYNVDDNIITGKYNEILNNNEALTVRMELPEGYFTHTGSIINLMDYIILLIPILFLGIAIFLWYKFGRDDKVIETVEFYPPEGFNSLEVGFLYKGKADNQDVISLLIYLANKGYIKISETEDKSLFSKIKGFKITRLKEYDGDNINEKIFLNGLFNKQASISENEETPTDNINEVTSMDLYNNFYITIEQILSNINNEENKNKIFEKSSSGKIALIVLMIIATYCIITIPPILTYGDPALLSVALLFPGVGFSLMFSTIFGETQTIHVGNKAIHSSIATKLTGLFAWGVLFGGTSWAFLVMPSLLQDLTYFIGYIVGLICVLGMVICIKKIPKRTPYGNEILGKLKGFRSFLETAEKDKLEAMVMQDPTYFYNILPFTYVLGISDKWIKKFEDISLQAPSWYDSSVNFNMVTFETFINNTMLSAQSVALSSYSSGSSDSSSSGGGSSGGGSGGGGGGSW